MPVNKLSDVSTALSLLMAGALVSNINQVTVLPHILPITRGEGKAVNWTVEFSGAANAVASAEGVARSSSDADAELEVPATLPWAQYDKTASVSDMAQAAVSSNIRPESLTRVGRDLLLGRLSGSAARLARGIAADLYAGASGDTPPEIAGLAAGVDSSGTFAGIVPGTYTEWVSTESTGALAAVSFEVIREFFSDIYEAGGEMPDVVVTTPTVFNALRGLFANYEAHVRQEITLNRGGGVRGEEPRTVKLSGGMRCIEIEGVPFVQDRDCTSGTMYALNTNYIELQQLDPYQSVLDGGKEAINDLFSRLADKRITLPSAQIEGMMAKNTGLRPRLKLLGDRGLSTEGNVSVFAQTKWGARNKHGKYLFT